MTTVERILSICKERNIPVSRLEKACSFSNGYLKSLKNGTMSFERLHRVALFLNVSDDYLAFGESDGAREQIAALSQRLMDISKQVGIEGISYLCAHFEAYVDAYIRGMKNGRTAALNDIREKFADIPELVNTIDIWRNADAES